MSSLVNDGSFLVEEARTLVAEGRKLKKKLGILNVQNNDKKKRLISEPPGK